MDELILSNSTAQQANFEPYVFTDTNGGVTYVGTSVSFNDGNAAIWRIKKQWCCGTVCLMGFPNGCQAFEFAWGCRCSYTYC